MWITSATTFFNIVKSEYLFCLQSETSGSLGILPSGISFHFFVRWLVWIIARFCLVRKRKKKDFFPLFFFPNSCNFLFGFMVAVFNYNSAMHNVVAVNKDGYSRCTTPPGAKVYQTGKDQIKLAKGQNFFICNFPGHCGSGMKIAVTAVWLKKYININYCVYY